MNYDQHNAQVIENIRIVAKSLDARALAAMKNVMLHLQEPVKKKVPVDLGMLRASIDYTVNLEVQGVVGTLGIRSGKTRNGTTVGDYAIYVHQGTGIYATGGGGRKTPWVFTVEEGKYEGTWYTSGQKSNPFMRDAVNQNKSKINDWFNQAFIL